MEKEHTYELIYNKTHTYENITRDAHILKVDDVFIVVCAKFIKFVDGDIDSRSKSFVYTNLEEAIKFCNDYCII